MDEIFSVNNIFFTVLGYPMSYLEFFGTVLNILCVWLVARKNIWNWPVGIVAVILFAVLFYQIRLYSDMMEQAYYFITGFYGWWMWLRFKKGNDSTVLQIKYNTSKANIIWLTVIGLGTLVLGNFVSKIHIYFPNAFTEPASFPYLDALTTVMSLVAQILLVHKRVESWVLWVAVDVIGVWLYYVKDVKLVSLLYLIFLFIAIKGLVDWHKDYKSRISERSEV